MADEEDKFLYQESLLFYCNIFIIFKMKEILKNKVFRNVQYVLSFIKVQVFDQQK